MTVEKLCAAAGFRLLCGDKARLVTGVYSCDLLSLAMGTAPAGCAWVTVLGHLNTVAVAALADVGCILLAHGVPLAPEALARAEQKGIPVLGTPLPVFEAALGVHLALAQEKNL